MEDKVVLVTGSSSGIGHASVVSFAKLGCKVVVHGTDETRLADVAQECKRISPKMYEPLKIACDLRDDKEVKRLMAETVACFGQLDVLVNNAGLFKCGLVVDSDSYQRYREMMRINLDHVVLLTTLAIPHLTKTRGCIINISSNLHSKCMNGTFAYCTAKAGLTMFTKSIAVDLAPDIRVNSVSPGPTATLMSTRSGITLDDYRKNVSDSCLVGRIAEAEEIARVILFLASPASSYITGSDFIIDGGSSIKPSGKMMTEKS